MKRCEWCGDDPQYVAYHDDEWGRPVTDDRRLFEKLCLEGFQAGLSWLTILRKRENEAGQLDADRRADRALPHRRSDPPQTFTSAMTRSWHRLTPWGHRAARMKSGRCLARSLGGKHLKSAGRRRLCEMAIVCQEGQRLRVVLNPQKSRGKMDGVERADRCRKRFAGSGQNAGVHRHAMNRFHQAGGIVSLKGEFSLREAPLQPQTVQRAPNFNTHELARNDEIPRRPIVESLDLP